MPCDKIEWLHSNGPTNKEPSHDLGNSPSEFQIAEVSMNNLYDDVKPEEAAEGLVDYRCFYICNKHQKETIEDVMVTMDPEQCADGSTIEIGLKLCNDKQEILIEGNPDDGGYVIFDTEFGAPFTVYFTDAGGFGGFVTDFETQIHMQPWSSGIIVSGTNPFTVEFAGELKNRKVKLIRVVQNNLLSKDWSRYNTVSYEEGDSFNGEGESEIKTTRSINDEYVDSSGTLRVYNPSTGLYESVPYLSYVGDIFTLSAALTFDLPGKYGPAPPGSPVFDDNDPSPSTDSFPPLPAGFGVVEAPITDHTALVHICKTKDGSPINCIAEPIPSDTDAPDGVTFGGGPLDVGILRPQECFFIWTKRETLPGTGPFFKDNFSLTFAGTAVSWPP